MSHANVLDPKFRNDEGAHGIMVRLLCRLAHGCGTMVTLPNICGCI